MAHLFHMVFVKFQITAQLLLPASITVMISVEQYFPDLLNLPEVLLLKHFSMFI